MNKEKNIAVPNFSYLQQNGKPQRFTSYFSDMATWIRKDVCEAVDSGLLNFQMTGPRHCEVVKCEKRKIEDTSGSYIKRITDNQTSIIAVFLKEAVDEMLQKRLEEPEDSEINWEEGVIMLEKYRIIYLSLPESKTGTFAIQVDKFDYLGEPLSSLMKDYPFVIQRSEDDPKLQKKCQDFEQKFAVKQTSLDTLRLKQAQAPDSQETSTELESLLIDVLEEIDPLAKISVKESVKSLCAGNNAADFLLISSQSSQVLDNPGADTVSKACDMNSKMPVAHSTPAVPSTKNGKQYKVLRSGRLIHGVNQKQTSDTKCSISEQKTSSLNDNSLLFANSVLSEDYNTRSKQRRTLKNYENEQNTTEKSVLASRSPSKRKSVDSGGSSALKDRKYIRKESSVTSIVNVEEKRSFNTTLLKDCDNVTCIASTDEPDSIIHDDFDTLEDFDNRCVDKNMSGEFYSNSGHDLIKEKYTINESNSYCKETRIVSAVSQGLQPCKYIQSESNTQEEELNCYQKTTLLSSEEYATTPDLNILEVSEGPSWCLSQIPWSNTKDHLKNKEQKTAADNMFSHPQESLDEPFMISPTPVKEDKKNDSKNNFKRLEYSRLEAQKEIISDNFSPKQEKQINNFCTPPHCLIDLTHSSSSEENEAYVSESKTALPQNKMNTESSCYADNNVESQVDSLVFDGFGMTYTFRDSHPDIVEKPSNNYSDHLNRVTPLPFDKDTCKRNLNFQPKGCHDISVKQMEIKRFDPWCNVCERSLISCTCSLIRANLNTRTDSEISPILSKSKSKPKPYLTPDKEKPKSGPDVAKIEGTHESGLDITAYERKYKSRPDVIGNEGKHELEIDVATVEGKCDVGANKGTSYSLQVEEGESLKFSGILTSAEVTLPKTNADLTGHHNRSSCASVSSTGYVSFDFTDSQIERMMHLLLRMLDIKQDT